MTDRELLEMAAKACGWRVATRREFGGINVDVGGGSTIVKWNPLTDDGDALRLAVALGFRVSPGLAVTKSHCSFGEGSIAKAADPCAATRRAIVRAAAAMVKP